MRLHQPFRCDGCGKSAKVSTASLSNSGRTMLCVWIFIVGLSHSQRATHRAMIVDVYCNLHRFPIWFYGFLHFWPAFAQTPLDHNIQQPAGPPSHPSQATSPPTSPPPSYELHSSSAKASSSPRKAFFSGNFKTSCRPFRASSTPLPLYVETYRYKHASEWRLQERRWALRCGYAIAALWTLCVVIFAFALVKGVFAK